MSARPERNQTTMAIKADKARAPRGAKNVTQAFFAALDAVPDSQRAAIAAAALTAIRDEVKARRQKAKEAAARAKAKAPTARITPSTAFTSQPAPARTILDSLIHRRTCMTILL